MADPKIIFASLTVWLLPCLAGWACLSIWDRNKSPRNFQETLALSFAGGMVLWTWLAWLAYQMGMSLIGLGVIFLLVSAGGFFYSWKKFEQPFRVNFTGLDFAIIAGALVLTVIFYHVGSHQQAATDSFRHLIFIRKIFDRGHLGEDVFFFSQSVPYTMLNTHYSYNGLYPLYALISKVFGLDPAVLWFYISSTLILPTLAVFFTVARNLSGNRLAGWIAVSILLLIWALLKPPIRGFVYPHHIGWMVYFTVAAVLIRKVSEKKVSRPVLLALALSGSSLLSIHPQWWLFLFITLMVSILYSLALREYQQFRELLKISGMILLFSLPMVFVRYQFYQHISSELGSILHSRYEKILYRMGDWFAINPLKSFRWMHYAYLSAAMVILGMVFRSRDRGARFGAGVTAFHVWLVALVLVIPPAFSLVARFVTTTLAMRMQALIVWWGIFSAAILIAEVLKASAGFLPEAFRQWAESWQEKKHFQSPGWLLLGGVLGMAVTIVLIKIPKSGLDPKPFVQNDERSIGWQGPTLLKIADSPQVQSFYKSFPDRSVITTDARELIMAFKDVDISGDVNGLGKKAREVNQRLARIFKKTTPFPGILGILKTFPAPYLILTPRSSHLSWMKFDRNPKVFEKVAEAQASNFEYYTSRFVAYKIHIGSGLPEKNPEKIPQPDNCSPRLMKTAYKTEIPPKGWGVNKGNELTDGGWGSTGNSLLWFLPRETWFYIDFDLHQTAWVNKVVIRNTHFTNAYHLKKLAVFFSNDGKAYYESGRLEFAKPHAKGTHAWVFKDLERKASHVRIAVQSRSLTTLGEVQIIGCAINNEDGNAI